MNSRLKRGCAVTFVIAGVVCRCSLAAQLPPQSRPGIGVTEDLATLVLVKSDEGKAVIRFGTGPLTLISRGDRLGRHLADVVEIAAGRLVLEEAVAGRDGRPNRALIILKDGDIGGKRFLARPDEPRPMALRPAAVVPRDR